LWQELVIPYALPEWKELEKRWEFYYPFFEFTPFYQDIQRIDTELKKTARVFTERLPDEAEYKKLSLSLTLQKIYDKLHEIDKLYIRPEIS
jgi:hypothetical protein